jgi:hypothetical protein
VHTPPHSDCQAVAWSSPELSLPSVQANSTRERKLQLEEQLQAVMADAESQRVSLETDLASSKAEVAQLISVAESMGTGRCQDQAERACARHQMAGAVFQYNQLVQARPFSELQ